MIPVDFPVLAYVGPETILPVTSVLAAIGGAFMMFGRYFKTLAVSYVRRFIRR